ncbi:MAG: threonylcarbamoyl-AMP synthase [Chloroflexi bacterium]|nr:threonylcarbamoyl-AMP synthase [Chloroflexota bacterium]
MPRRRTVILAADPAGIAAAAGLLRDGHLVAFPTDTLYALGALATDARAVAAVFRAKGRGEANALPVLLADAADLPRVARDVPPAARRLAARFWPGELTIIVPARADLPPLLHGHSGTIATRVPAHEAARALIRAAGGPLTGTSANRSGAAPARTPAEVLAQLGGRIHAVLDGLAPGGTPSTVVDATATPPRVLRLGAVSADALRAALDGDVAV